MGHDDDQESMETGTKEENTPNTNLTNAQNEEAIGQTQGQIHDKK